MRGNAQHANAQRANTDSATLAHVHWTAWLSFITSGLLAPVFPVLFALAYRAPLLNLLLGFIPFYLLAMVFALIAVRTASRAPWRAGRWLASVALFLTATDLLLFLPFIVYLIDFWHPGHLVF